MSFSRSAEMRYLIKGSTKVNGTIRMSDIKVFMPNVGGKEQSVYKFSSNQFNFGDGNENNGNIVFLRSATSQVECDVVKYWTTTSKIYCDTRAAIPGVYSVYVTVDGVEVDSYCNSQSCNFEYRDGSTPKITSVTPRACTPDNVITVNGFVVSDIVSDTQTEFEDYEDSNTAITLKRVYMGASICDLVDQETGTV
ncbi:fibrocystin-L-like [Anneissia japonica]|uniref:fibrocystin-L-like n=1 Tax=Anneissia japonica TaxID=1529436 RepID=UPI001425AD95|nr:fibrocystin-L-like [Anneissia japonica]